MGGGLYRCVWERTGSLTREPWEMMWPHRRSMGGFSGVQGSFDTGHTKRLWYLCPESSTCRSHADREREREIRQTCNICIRGWVVRYDEL